MRKAIQLFIALTIMSLIDWPTSVWAQSNQSTDGQRKDCAAGQAGLLGICPEDLAKKDNVIGNKGMEEIDNNSELGRKLKMAIVRAEKSESLGKGAGEKARASSILAQKNGTVINYDNGRYEGDKVAGIREGYGVYAFNDGERYEGQWRQGSRYGFAQWSYRDTRYDGEWDEDKTIVAYGVRTYPDGRRYVGELKGIRPNGLGALYSGNGAVLARGVWENGNLRAKK